MDPSNVPPPGDRVIKEPKRRLNRGTSGLGSSSNLFGAASQSSFSPIPPTSGSPPIFNQQSPPVSAPAFTFGQQPQQPQQSTSSFFSQMQQQQSTSTSQPSFSFGSPATSQATTSSFGFGSPVQNNPSSSGSSPFNSFGTNTNANTSNTSSSNISPAFSFGNINPPPTANTSNAFGQSSTNSNSNSNISGINNPTQQSTAGFSFGKNPNTSTTNTGFSFGSPNPSTSTTQPPVNTVSSPFSFGKKDDKSDDKPSQPAFSFGTPAKKEGEKDTTALNKPAFSFGSVTSTTTTGVTADKNTSTTSTSSITTSTSTSFTSSSNFIFPSASSATTGFGTPAPAPSFTTDTSKQPSLTTSSFAFGNVPKTDDKKEGEQKKDDNRDSNQPPATSSFGTPAKKDDKPAAPFSFGTPATNIGDKKDNNQTLSNFSFGTQVNKDDDKEKSSNKPTYQFGTPAKKDDDKNKSSDEPTFSFGTPPAKKDDDKDKAIDKPTFSFGTPAKKDDDKNKPTDRPAFSFGTPAKKTDDKEISSSEKPALSFGFPSTSTTTIPTAPKSGPSPFSIPFPPNTTTSAPNLDSSKQSTPFSFGTTKEKEGIADSNNNNKKGDTENIEKITDTSENKSITESGTPTTSKPFSFNFGSTPAVASPSQPASSNLFNFTTSLNKDATDKNKEQSASKPPSFNFSAPKESSNIGDKPPTAFSFGQTSKDVNSIGGKRKGDDFDTTEPSKSRHISFKTPIEPTKKLQEPFTLPGKKDEQPEKSVLSSSDKDSIISSVNLASVQKATSAPSSSTTTTTASQDSNSITKTIDIRGTATKDLFSVADITSTTPKSGTPTNTAPASITKPADSFKPFVTTDSTPITVSSVNTPVKNISKSLSTSKDVFGIAPPTTSVPTAIQSNITSVDQIKKATRFVQLPGDAQSVLLEAEQFIHNQQLISRNIQSRIDAFGGEDILQVNTQVSELLNNGAALKDQLQAQLQIIDRLGDDIQYQLRTTTANKMILDYGNTKRTSGSGEHQQYFIELYERLRTQLVEFEYAIRQIEERLQQEMMSGKSPQDIGMLISSQNQLFLSLSGRASELHQRVEALFEYYSK
ncbi:hypothetical protein BJ944DRAFT_58960 [Cunninghamella echinulata]|nr:hypothetical protein BJ944DRAFT_58960 [Cunninghamella echinulata]